VHAGEAVCPGMLCTALFRYFESEGSLAAVRERAAQVGVNEEGAAVGATDCEGSDQQRDC